ncbi:MAG: methyltransferase domain-containing protein [Gemmataceae bacterium]
MNDTPRQSEAERLEALWAGDFGDAYVERNKAAGDVREPFWRGLLAEFPAASALEVGCNLGGNLKWVAAVLPPHQVFGVDVNLSALRALRAAVPDVNAVHTRGRDLPFRDRWFDLVFTMGVLIHQPESTLPLVMSEIVRCSRKYVVCGEYYSQQTVEVPYRGHSGALFKRDYGGLYQALFPELVLRKKGFMGKDQGWDDVTYWVFEKV